MTKTQEQVSKEHSNRFHIHETPRMETDPIRIIRKRMSELDIEWMRIDNTETVCDSDNSYSQSYDEKRKNKSAIQKLINENQFALDVLLNARNLTKSKYL